ncbi:hypothetical protein B0H19DRAFT_152216 [Mycena capillaripes]|nr:hypothetical protein B0H19DRAFT_152216 [Mycena capillaripes]
MMHAGAGDWGFLDGNYEQLERPKLRPGPVSANTIPFPSLVIAFHGSTRRLVLLRSAADISSPPRDIDIQVILIHLGHTHVAHSSLSTSPMMPIIWPNPLAWRAAVYPDAPHPDPRWGPLIGAARTWWRVCGEGRIGWGRAGSCCARCRAGVCWVYGRDEEYGYGYEARGAYGSGASGYAGMSSSAERYAASGTGTASTSKANEVFERYSWWDVVRDGTPRGSETEEDGDADVDVVGDSDVDNTTRKDCVRGNTGRRERRREQMPDSICPSKMRNGWKDAGGAALARIPAPPRVDKGNGKAHSRRRRR